MNIRKAKVKDIPQTCKLGYELNRHHEKFDEYFGQSKNALAFYKESHRKNIYSSRSLFLIAENNGEIVAYIIAKIDKRPPVYKVRDIGFIVAMYVKKDYRRRGISKKFFGMILPWFKSKKVKYVELHVHGRNDPALKTWGSHKFSTFLLHQRMRL